MVRSLPVPARIHIHDVRGFSLVEVVATLTLLGILMSMAIPTLQRLNGRAALQNGRAAVAAALTTAQAAATRWGRTSTLRLDAAGDRLWTVVDTASDGPPDTLVLGLVHLRADLGVNLRTDQESLCFNSRGVGTTSRTCPQAGATLILEHGDRADTVRINAAGRIWR